MQELNKNTAYPEGHMGNRITQFERRYNNLFGGQLRLQFIVPSDHVSGDGSIDIESLKTQALALLAVDGGDMPDNENVAHIAQKLGDRIADNTGGAAFDADYLHPTSETPESLRGVIYPGTRNFRSGALLASYCGDRMFEAHTYKYPLSETHLHLDRVLYHEIGHKVLDFIDCKKHPLADRHPFPEKCKGGDERYMRHRSESFADGFMALMMVRDHGEVGKTYAEMIGHARGLGFENGYHRYYTTKTIEAALKLAEEYGDELKNTPTEELASALFERQHEVMWTPAEFKESCEQQKQYCKFVMADAPQADAPEYHWLREMRYTHEEALMDAMCHPEATPENLAARDALIEDYTNECRRELDYVWEGATQKRVALHETKYELRTQGRGRTVLFDEDELEQTTLNLDEKMTVLDTLAHEVEKEKGQPETSLADAYAER